MYLEHLNYGGVELPMRLYIDAATRFIIDSIETPFRFYTDMASASEIVFLVQVNNTASLVDPVPYLDERVVKALTIGDINALSKICRSANVEVILFYKSNIPFKIRGAQFGPGRIIKLHGSIIHHSNMLYQSSKVLLLTLENKLRDYAVP